MQRLKSSAPTRRRVPSSIDAADLTRVQCAAAGAVFTPARFAKTGSRAAVDQTLQRLVERDALRRLTRDYAEMRAKQPVLDSRS